MKHTLKKKKSVQKNTDAAQVATALFAAPIAATLSSSDIKSKADEGDSAAPTALERSMEQPGESAAQVAAEVDAVVDTAIAEPARHVIQVYKAECPRCVLLFPDVIQQKPFKAKVKGESDKKFGTGVVKLLNQTKIPSCHHSKGNAACPAREFRVVVGLNVEQYAQRHIRYEQERDAEAMQELLSKINASDEVIQTAFWSALSDARKKAA